MDKKIALITGAGYGIGRSIAKKLAQNGADIVIADIREDGGMELVVDEVESYGRKALAVQTDVRDPESFSHAVEKTLENFGRIDLFVNNAGFFASAPLLEMTEEIWYSILDVDLKAALFCTKTLANYWVTEKINGKVVIIGSVHGTRSWQSLTAYAAAKTGLKGLVKILALELSPYKINVNLVSPGLISTPITNEWSKEEEFQSRIKKEIPWGRMGEPYEVANVVHFLLSEESNYVTGTEIVVDGGLLLYSFSI